MKKNNKKYTLYGKHILITGASSGIGRNIALAYAKEGAKLILLSRNIADLESLYDIIVKNDNAFKPYIYPFDFLHSSWNKYEKLHQVIKKEFTYIDGLICNAAVLGKLSPVEHIEIQDWYKVIQVNLNSTFMLVKSLMGLLKKSEKPVVLCNTMDNLTIPKAFWGAYSISKSGLNNLIQMLSIENKNVVFHLVDPGKINTKLTRNAFPIGKISDLKKPKNIVDHYLYLILNTDKNYNYNIYKI